ncbi:MAG TPA: DsbA family protein, partial [Rhodanobacteraceae bacterium]
HADAFKAKFQYNFPMNSLADYANFYARHGVNKAAFLKAAHSPRTDREMAANNRLIMRWRVMGTPTIVVDGKYRSNHIKSYDQLVALTKWLVQRELKARH